MLAAANERAQIPKPECYFWHMTTEQLWNQAHLTGYYVHPSLEKQGYVHLFTCSQWREAQRRYLNWYKQNGQVPVHLQIDPQRVTAEVKYEPSKLQPHKKYPHLYGALNLDSVVDVARYTRRKLARTRTWTVTLCQACTQHFSFWLQAVFCGPCVAFKQRRQLLEDDFEASYECCQGYTCITKACSCRSCPTVALGLEVCCCCPCAVLANRALTQLKFNLTVVENMHKRFAHDQS